MPFSSFDKNIDDAIKRINFRLAAEAIYLIRLYELLKIDSQQNVGHLSTHSKCLGFQTSMMVEVNGIEPMTPCLQSRCSPS